VARRPVPSDARAVLALVVTCDFAAIGESDATLTQVESDLAWPDYDRERSGWLVEDGEGRVVGWLWSADERPADAVFLDPYAERPDVLEWLFARGLEYVADLAAERERTMTVRAGSYEHDRFMSDALARAGLAPVRHFWRMRLDLPGGDEGGARPVTPASGVDVRVMSASEADLRVMHRLHTESFRDHWNSTPHPFDAWCRQMEVGRGRDPSQWWVAYVGGEPVGVLLGDESEADHDLSSVGVLGVLRPFRGRGVATTLLATAFAEARRRGRAGVVLMVDSESPTGATRLYESVGMRVDKVMLSWQATVPPGVVASASR
jgi:ribosomal protein S18 acetylase RimI-like enzyme